jgi:hypothetical protein
VHQVGFITQSVYNLWQLTAAGKIFGTLLGSRLT